MIKRSSWLVIPVIFLLTIILLAVAGFFGLEFYTATVLKKEIDQRIQDISDYVRVDYDSLGVNWLGYTVDLHKVRLYKPPLPGVVTIDRVAVRDFTSIGIRWIPTKVVLENIAGSNDEFNLAAGRLATSFTLSRIPTEEEIDNDWTVLLANLQKGTVKLDKFTFSDKEAKLAVDSVTTDYAGASGSRKNFGLDISNLKFQSADVDLNSKAFGFSASLGANNVLDHFANKINDFSLKFPAGQAGRNPFFEQLAALGYDRLSLASDLDYDFHPDKKNLHLSLNTSAVDMGQLRFDVHLVDYHSPPVPVTGSLASLLDFFENLRNHAEKASLQGFTARYHDLGLVPRLIKTEAQAAGQTPEQFTQNLVSSVNAAVAIFPLPASLKDQVKAVNRFLVNPQEIQLDITCHQPVRLQSLQEGSLSAALELLGKTDIKITSK